MSRHGPHLTRALRHRNYRLFFSGQSIASFTWGSAPHPGSVARGGPRPRSAPSPARRARLAPDEASR